MIAADDSPIARSVAALGTGAFDEDSLQQHVAPLFTRHRAESGGTVYLANHSLGRPLDATATDLGEGLGAWYAAMGGAWDAWRAAQQSHRARLAELMHAPRVDCVVPKTSAGQGLRAVLNAFDGSPRVVATTAEFDSLDMILREYARRGRIRVEWVPTRADGSFASEDLVAAARGGCDLVVASEVLFASGQRLDDMPAIVAAAHSVGAKLLLDIYHSLGAFDVDVARLGVDYAVGGSYKYLRGGPGACFLYVAPTLLDAGVTTLDIGWFAKPQPLAFAGRDNGPAAAGGDGWLESTPPVLTYYQARAGQQLLLALGIERIRAHSLQLQRRLVAHLAAYAIEARGGEAMRGAFVVVHDARAAQWAQALARLGIAVDARGPWLRICPDLLTTEADLKAVATALAGLR
ncbi:MAG: aminotransferase class V-fold PLP-dependent enzyme [Casimicrobiaceae bacterium]